MSTSAAPASSPPTGVSSPAGAATGRANRARRSAAATPSRGLSAPMSQLSVMALGFPPCDGDPLHYHVAAHAPATA